MFFLKTFSLIFYMFSFLFCRKENIWCFGSETGFDGNTKYFLYYLLDNHPEIRPIWITKRKSEINILSEKGIESYYSFSLKGLYYSLVASRYIVSGSLADINFYASGGVKYIQLWHGIGIKCCLWNNKNSIYNTDNSIIGFIKRPSFYIEPDYILGASEMMNHILASMFRARVERCHSTLYPRCEIFQKSKQEIKEMVKRREGGELLATIERMESYHRVIIYMPTYRDSNQSFLEEQNWDMSLLNSSLVANNNLLIMKLHPHMKSSVDISGCSNIIEIKSNLDIYPILPFTDTLITDYSSIFYDYILMDKKLVILYIPDIDDYIENSRELLMDYSENTKGVRVKSFMDLVNHINDEDETDYQQLREKFWYPATSTNNDTLFVEIVNS